MRDHMMGFPPAALCETDQLGAIPFEDRAWIGRPARWLDDHRAKVATILGKDKHISAFNTGDHGAKLGITEGACKTGEAYRACIGTVAPLSYRQSLELEKTMEMVSALERMTFRLCGIPDHDAAQQVAQSEQPAPTYPSHKLGATPADAWALAGTLAQHAVAAEAAEKPQEQWFEHKGGECPVPVVAPVWVKFRDGMESSKPYGLSDLIWEWDCDYVGKGKQIVAWRYA